MSDPTIIVVTVQDGPASVDTQVPGQTGPTGRYIVDADINVSDHLILTLSDASTIDAGALPPGPTGPQGVSITGATIDGSYHLILSRSAGGDLDAGYVRGPTGANGVSITGASIDGSGHLIITYSSGGPDDVGDVTGDDGISVTGATVDGSYHLILTLSDASTIDAGYVRGPAGAGTGDVVGVAPSVAGNFASFTDTTAKEIEDSGLSASSFATAAQGTKADTAVQPGDLGTAAAEDVGYFATAAQGALADTAVQPADLGTAAAEDVGYFATAAQGTKADSAIQSITETGNGININVSVPTAPVFSLDATLEAVANFVTGANKVIYWTGTDTLSSFDTTAYTRGFMAAVDAAAARTALVLGTVATLNTGTGAGNIPILDGSGLLDTAILPALAITVPSVVGSQAAMLALTAQQGDVAIRTDLNKSFILSTNSPGTLADWKELLTPTDAVLSVAALTGAISAASLLTALGLSTSDSPQFTGLNIGHATDTTITRSSAGVLAVEGAIILTQTSPVANSPTLNNAITVESSANNSSTNFAIDLANGTLQVITLTGNWVPSTGWPTATAGQFFRLIIKQDGTGSRTITWPSSVKWPASTAPTITATASKADVIDFSSDGTNWFGVVVGQVYL